MASWRFNHRWGWPALLVGLLCAAILVAGQSSSSASGYSSACAAITDENEYYRNDGDCDSDLNTQDCGWDGGDCCKCTCTSSVFVCGDNDEEYDCQDPDANCDVTPSPAQTVVSPTPTPTTPSIQQSAASTSDGTSGALIGSICAAACSVVLLAVCAGVYCIRARKRKNAAPARGPSVQHPVPAGDGNAVGANTAYGQHPIAA